MKYLKHLLAAAMTVLLVACGGGGGGGGGGQGAGVGGTGISYGPVSGFGSIVVNGKRYNNASASYTGEITTANQLQVGMVVTVKHNGAGTATGINYRDNAEGPISAINLAGNSLTVLGLTVQVNNLTVFANTLGLSALAVGNRVEVSGMLVSENTLLATRIEYKSATCSNGTPVEVEGTARNLTATTLSIGSLNVNFSTALLNDGVPANGDYIEVKGVCPVGNPFMATSIERENDGPDGIDDLDDGDEIEIKGFVSGLAGSGSTRTFSINGRMVATSSSTSYEDGTVNNLANGVLVEVEGDLNSVGTLVARKIEFEQEGEADSEIEITAIPTAKTSSAFNTGTLTLLGMTVKVSPDTQFIGGSSSSPFNLGTITANSSCLEVEAFLDSTSALVATSIEREDADDCDEVELQGPVSNKAQPNFDILSVSVMTSGGTSYEEGTMTQGQFFSAISNGSLVKAKGSFSSGILTATEVERED